MTTNLLGRLCVGNRRETSLLLSRGAKAPRSFAYAFWLAEPRPRTRDAVQRAA
jgi:hypothetical protein